MTGQHHYRKEIVYFGHMLHERGFVAATDGNLSVLLDSLNILVTPTSMSKGRMRPADLVIVDMEGRRLSGRRAVSSVIAMHLLIYRLRLDVNVILHSNTPIVMCIDALIRALM